MPNAVIIPNEKSKYAENLFPYKSTLNVPIDLNISEGGDNAVVEVTNINVPLYNRLNVIRAITTDTGVCVFNLGDALEFIAPTTGYYILSVRIYIPTLYSSGVIYGKISQYLNSSATDFDYSNQNPQFIHGQWNTLSQVVYAEKDDVFTHDIKLQSDTLGSRIYFGGFDIKLDDRGLQGVTPFYSEPYNPNIGLIVNKTTAEINAITTPFEGEQYYNTTLHTICFYDGTEWKKISNTTM